MMYSSIPFTNVSRRQEQLSFHPGCRMEGPVPEMLKDRLINAAARHSSAEGRVPFIRFAEEPSAEKDSEGYELLLEETGILVKAGTERGLFYGAQTLLRLLEEKTLYAGMVQDVPLVRRRWFKCYLPPPTPEGMRDFKILTDMLARFKYNGIMIEVGGAMEYEKHPEINQGWIEYSNFMNEYSGKPQKIQDCMRWEKNSIHTTNGGGKVLTKEQVRELIGYCRRNHLDVIPEMPSLSHCDYLLTKHPELAERPEDPFPDTACPLHPDYYPLLFDLFDEVLDVFQPEILHIGHDEYYSYCLCPRCRERKAHELYAEDIRRCYDFLKSRGVKTMIWGEKLLDAHMRHGRPCGGAEIPPRNGKPGLAALWPCADLLPGDLFIMHWYWSIGRALENTYIKHGFPWMFGNFAWRECPDWSARIRPGRASGVSVSSWGNTDLRSLQRNGLLFDMVSLSAACWNPALTGETDYPAVRDWTFGELCRMEEQLNPGPSLRIRQTCDWKREYEYFFDGIFVDEQKDLIGYHQLRDEEGRLYELPLIYGSHISCSDVSMDRIAPVEGDGRAMDTMQCDMRLFEPGFPARPVRLDDGRTGWICRYLHPAPGKKLHYAGFRHVPGREFIRVEAELV